MNKAKYTGSYIALFFLGLFIMNILLVIHPVVAILFFVVYLVTVRISLNEKYNQEKETFERRNPEDERIFSKKDPESPEGRAERRSNYRD